MYQETQRMSVLRAARRPPDSGQTGARMRGFTLIELMVTLAIVAILAAIAYPSYLSHVRKANRAAAQGYMLEVANLQQRFLLDARQYAQDLPTLNSTVPTNVSAKYTVTTSLKTGTTLPGFLVTAAPIGAQALDSCGTLTVDETGLKTPSGSSCW